MNNNTFAFATSIKCAATVLTLGARLKNEEPISVNINTKGQEEIRYHFETHTGKGIKVQDLISAFSIIARGGLKPGLAEPSPEALSVIKDAQHPLHVCQKALAERDRLHELVLIAAKGIAYPITQTEDLTNDTKLAACLSVLGHQPSNIKWDGRRGWFFYNASAEINKFWIAYEAAWGTLTLEPSHPMYFMKTALERREELFCLRKYGVKEDGRVARNEHESFRKVEPYIIEKRGAKIILTPVNITPENLEKAQKYL
jgi:hypothetical protein